MRLQWVDRPQRFVDQPRDRAGQPIQFQPLLTTWLELERAVSDSLEDLLNEPVLDDLEALTEQIARRRSFGLKGLLPDPVPREMVEQILEAARSVIAESGVAALSVRTVAARAGIGASTLRYHFPTLRPGTWARAHSQAPVAT